MSQSEAFARQSQVDIEAIPIKSALHTDCYQDGEILMPEMRYIITEDAKEFLDNVQALVGIRRYSQAPAPALARGD